MVQAPERTILVVEDEPSIASAVAARLRSEGYAVEIAGDGPSAVEACERLRPDLVVLDVMLPGFDGLEVCRRIQRDQPVPVLMLTARDSETDLVVGLAVGADDYLTKPFRARELVARVQAILRRDERSRARLDADRASTEAAGRVDAGDAAGAPSNPPVRRVGDVEIDPSSRRVRRADEIVHLTPLEFDLLHFLARRPGVVYTREQLLSEVWGYRDGSGARTVDSHVQAIRRKVGAAVVRTVHGVGYAVEQRGAERAVGPSPGQDSPQ
jgi:DNA-binding response OmpR family regulator